MGFFGIGENIRRGGERICGVCLVFICVGIIVISLFCCVSDLRLYLEI